MDPIFDLHQRNFGNMGEHGAIYFFGKDRVADTEFLLARLNWHCLLYTSDAADE